MAYSIIAQREASAAAAGGNIALGASQVISAGQWVVGFIAYADAAERTSLIVDNLGNSYAQLGSAVNISGGFFHGFAGRVTTGGTATFTAQIAGSTATFRGGYVAVVDDIRAVDAVRLFQYNTQAAPGTGANAITSGAAQNLDTQPALHFAFCMDVNGNQSVNAGTGFTGLTQVWAYGGSNEAMRPQHRRLTATGNVQATFTTTSGGSSFGTFHVVLAEDEVQAVTGTGALSVGTPTVAGAGNAVRPHSGTGALTVSAATVAGSGDASTPTLEISDTFIGEDGVPQANLTGITVLIWRANIPSGAPDQVITDQETDGDGIITVVIDTGSLDPGDFVFALFYRGNPPTEQTCGRFQTS